MTTAAPSLILPSRDLALEEVPRRQSAPVTGGYTSDPDADLRPAPEATPGSAPARIAFPPRVIRGCRVQIVGDIAWVEVAGAVFAIPVACAEVEDLHDAVAVAVGMARDTVADWVAGKVHEMKTNPGFGTAVLS